MGRPPKSPFDRVKKDGFSAPQYLIAAAKKAAGVPVGRDFSSFVVAALEEKLRREFPGLIEETRQRLAEEQRPYGVPAPAHLSGQMEQDKGKRTG